MDRMLVVIFDRESKANEGKDALFQLENDNNIVVYAYAVVATNADGAARVAQNDDPRPVGTLLGAPGSSPRSSGGPTGAGLGAAAGLAAGAAVDVSYARIGEDFVEDIRQQLSPGKFALVAEIDEDWTFPVDRSMEALG